MEDQQPSTGDSIPSSDTPKPVYLGTYEQHRDKIAVVTGASTFAGAESSVPVPFPPPHEVSSTATASVMNTQSSPMLVRVLTVRSMIAPFSLRLAYHIYLKLQ